MEYTSYGRRLLAQASPLFLALLTLAGCGSGQVPVSGQVTFNGEPLTGATGTVTFTPVSEGASAAGPLDSDGNYHVSTGTDPGVAPGEYIVSVLATKPLTPKEAAPGKAPPPEELPTSLIPVLYSSPETSNLKVTVEAGKSNIPIALEK